MVASHFLAHGLIDIGNQIVIIFLLAVEVNPQQNARSKRRRLHLLFLDTHAPAERNYSLTIWTCSRSSSIGQQRLVISKDILEKKKKTGAHVPTCTVLPDALSMLIPRVHRSFPRVSTAILTLIPRAAS